MRRIATLFTLLALTAGLSACGSDAKIHRADADYSSALHASVIATGSVPAFSIAPQHVTIWLGKYRSWKLSVVVEDPDNSGAIVEVASKSTDAPANASWLDLSDSADLSTDRDGLLAQLIAGHYFLEVNGKPTDYTITVLPGSPPKPPHVTTTTRA